MPITAPINPDAKRSTETDRRKERSTRIARNLANRDALFIAY
jgi:hypothetical protein